MDIGFMSNHFRGLQRRIWSRSTPFQVVPWHVGNPTHRGGRVPNGSTRSLGCAAQKILSDFKPNIRTYPRPALTKSPKQRPSRASVVLHSPRNQQQTDAPGFWYMHVLACSQQGKRGMNPITHSLSISFLREVHSHPDSVLPYLWHQAKPSDFTW